MNSSNFIYLIFEFKIIQYPQIKLCLSGQNVSISWNYILLILTKIGNQIIWETIFQKLLGITTDNNLKLDAHIELSCKKIGRKLSALLRVSPHLYFKKWNTLMTSLFKPNWRIVHSFVCYTVGEATVL